MFGFFVLLMMVMMVLSIPSKPRIWLPIKIMALVLSLFIVMKYASDLYFYRPGRIMPRFFYSALTLVGTDSVGFVVSPDTAAFLPRSLARYRGDRVYRLIDDMRMGGEDVPTMAARALGPYAAEPRALMALFEQTMSQYSRDSSAAREALITGGDFDRKMDTLKKLILGKEKELQALYIYYLGNAYRANKRMREAVEMYTLAAEKGSLEAQNDLGMLYAEGKDGMIRDPSEAVKWFRKAVENKVVELRGSHVSQCNLALAYYRGEGVKKNHAAALAWYTKCAKGENAEAYFMLGQLYYNGFGTKKDYAQALKWYKRSASKGHSKAAIRIRMMYALGEGVPKDAIKGQNYVQDIESKRQNAEMMRQYMQRHGY